MQHPFEILKPQYEGMLAAVTVINVPQMMDAAQKLYRDIGRYRSVGSGTAVPPALLMAINMRESSGSLTANLCNGDPLTAPTIHVPRGRPPGARFPVSWETAAMDAVTFDGLNRLSVPAWSLAYACWKAEAYNGFGPRAHGHVSGYLWAGTTGYDGGKYVADGEWDSDSFDKQPGVIPLIWALTRLDSSLDFGGCIRGWTGAGDLPADVAPPTGVGGGIALSVKGLQQFLNALHLPGTPLLVDGSYGRRTRNVVRSYQQLRGLAVDGLAGPVTVAQLQHDMAEIDRGGSQLQ